MGAYAEAYLSDVVENQGKLFDYVAETFPDKDTEDFINFICRIIHGKASMNHRHM